MRPALADAAPIYGRIGEDIRELPNCPHCGVAHPSITCMWISQMFPRATRGHASRWAVYRCTGCGNGLLAQGWPNEDANNARILQIIPDAKKAHEDIPEPARTYLQQAYQTLHAPDAAAVMSGSAVDAMLKKIGYTGGSVYSRIEAAVRDHKLTENMGAWAHEVRLGSNRPRHADGEKPHVSPDEARQSVEFAEALGNFLFVLTERIKRGTEEAKRASAS